MCSNLLCENDMELKKISLRLLESKVTYLIYVLHINAEQASYVELRHIDFSISIMFYHVL